MLGTARFVKRLVHLFPIEGGAEIALLSLVAVDYDASNIQTGVYIGFVFNSAEPAMGAKNGKR